MTGDSEQADKEERARHAAFAASYREPLAVRNGSLKFRKWQRIAPSLLGVGALIFGAVAGNAGFALLGGGACVLGLLALPALRTRWLPSGRAGRVLALETWATGWALMVAGGVPIEWHAKVETGLVVGGAAFVLVQAAWLVGAVIDKLRRA